MIVFTKFDTPQDIYIFGAHVDREIVSKEMDDRTFGITDDYSTIVISNCKKSSTMETSGFVYVFTKEEFGKICHTFDETEMEQEGFVLKNFVGEIRLKVTVEIDKKEYDILDIYHPDEYLMHQPEMRKKLKELGDGDEYHDYVLEIGYPNFEGDFPDILFMDQLIQTFEEDTLKS
jgi:hypothetical protein